MKNSTILKLMTITVLAVAAMALLSACGGSTGDGANAVSDIEEHVDEPADDASGSHDEADSHDEAVEVSVIMTDDLTFEPGEIVVEAGTPVVLTIENAGLALHDFTIDDMPVHVAHHEGDSEDMSHMEGADHDEFAVHMALDGNGAGTLEFTPEEAGEYEFHCTVLGHTEAGMHGTLIVTQS